MWITDWALRRTDELHAPGDAWCAQQGWTATRTQHGFSRRYRDPRFDRIEELRSPDLLKDLDIQDTSRYDGGMQVSIMEDADRGIPSWRKRTVRSWHRYKTPQPTQFTGRTMGIRPWLFALVVLGSVTWLGAVVAAISIL